MCSDGGRLAVESEVRPPGNGQGRLAVLWLVEVASGAWKQLQTLEFGSLSGWDPGGRHIRISAPHTWLRLPVDGGKLESAEPLAEQATLADESLVFTLSDQPDTPVYLRHTFDSAGVNVLSGPGYKNRLTASGMYAALIVNLPDTPPSLVVLNLK